VAKRSGLGLLPVVLLAVDVLAGLVLGLVQTRSLSLGDRAVGLGLVFRAVDGVLLTLESTRLALVELAAGDALVNALFLIGLALVDAGRGSRCGRGLRWPGARRPWRSS
jgi:hypothetical protein